MSKSGPIVIIEDDRDDKEIFEEVTRDIGIKNEIIWFSDPDEAYIFLKETSKAPFLIFSDINLPGRTGLEIKKKIDDDVQLRSKSIPFVFFSTTANMPDIDYAYKNLTVQGFFKKLNNYNDMKMLLDNIYTYWMNCKHPNTE